MRPCFNEGALLTFADIFVCTHFPQEVLKTRNVSPRFLSSNSSSGIFFLKKNSHFHFQLAREADFITCKVEKEEGGGINCGD